MRTILICIFWTSCLMLTAQTTTTYAGEEAGTNESHNSFFGYRAGKNNTANSNTFIGSDSGLFNTVGTYNTFLGSGTGRNNTEGVRNVFIGTASGYSNIDGGYNLMAGFYSGFDNTGGNSNTFLGAYSGRHNTEGNNNTFLGYASGQNNINGINNTFLGQGSGRDNIDGGNNTFVGLGSGQLSNGDDNTFIGFYSGLNNAQGSANTFLGNRAGFNNSEGENNTFVGSTSGQSNTTGSHNTFIGLQSGYSNTEGMDNTFFGNASGFDNTQGSSNVFIGKTAGRKNTTGLGNIYLGRDAGHDNQVGSKNIFIGYGAGYTEMGSNKLYIDNSSTTSPLIYGEFDTNKVAVNGELKANNGIFENTTNGPSMDLKIGKKHASGNYNFLFYTNPNTVEDDDWHSGFKMRDKNDKERYDIHANNYRTRTNINDINGSPAYTFDVGSLGTNKVFIHLPKPDSRVVIGSWGNYLMEDGHKLVVKDGSAMIEGNIITNENIGIGTSNFTEGTNNYRLAVNGKIHAKEVKIDLNGWPDYVFESGYDLPTLKEVEQHISEKGHLINIPSAKTVEKEGILLGEINSKLLEKIEELTLYTIEQQKEIEAQQAYNKKLEKRLSKLEQLMDQKDN